MSKLPGRKRAIESRLCRLVEGIRIARHFHLLFRWQLEDFQVAVNNLTNRDLTLRITMKPAYFQGKVDDIIQRLFEHLTESLASGQTIEMRNFGDFDVRMRKSGIGRNPNRPEIDVPIPLARW